MKSLIALFLALLVAACGASGGAQPTVDPKVLEATIEARLFATQTAAAPTVTPTFVPTPTIIPTNTPRPTNTPAATSTPMPTNTPSLTTLIPPKGNYKHGFEVKVAYDKFTDRSSAQLSGHIENLNRVPNQLHAVYSVKGPSIGVPSSVIINFASISSDWQFPDVKTMIFLLDGSKRIVMDTTHDGSVVTGSVLEFVNGILDVSDFLTIVNSKTVEVKVSTAEFALTDEQMQALRDFASRMVP